MIGPRLRQARLAAGLTQDVLANLVEPPISKQALSKYERGRSQPSTRVLLGLARALGTKASRLLVEPSVQVQWGGWRKHAALKKSASDRITARAEQRLESEMELRSLFRVGIDHDFPKGFVVRGFEDAETAAEYVRRSWSIGNDPINSVIETIEDRGGVVLAWEEDGRFDGLSGWADGETPVIVVNATRSTDRIRFDAAHEVGHLMMHIDGPEAESESYAHRFAAAFLVPRAQALHELGERRRSLSIPELGLLKQRWGLSMQGWIRRAFDLDVINRSHYRSLNIEFRTRGWYREEPYSYDAVEEPLLMRRLVWRALTERVITRDDASTISPGYDEEPEARLEKADLSLRDLARQPIALRHEVIRQHPPFESQAELEDWERVEVEDLYNEEGQN